MPILKNKKIVLSITNNVTINQCANIILASGASPIMSRDFSDILDLFKITSSLVINIGTSNQIDIDIMLKTQKLFLKHNIPIILDPVGSGASKFRTNLARQIAKNGTTIIRGNASEIKSLVYQQKTKGVDSEKINLDLDVFKNISHKLNTVLLISGEKDIIIDKNKVKEIQGGHQRMQLLTGTGCMLSALTGALVTEFSPFEAAVKASQVMKKIGYKLFAKKLASYNEIYNEIINYE